MFAAVAFIIAWYFWDRYRQHRADGIWPAAMSNLSEGKQ